MSELRATAEGAAAATPARRFHFSMRGLLTCVFGIAFGLAEGRRGSGSVSDGLFAALAAWAAIGFGQQVRDLWRHFRGRDDLTPEQHWGVRFAIGWRVGVILLWLAYYIVRECQAVDLLLLPERADSYGDVGRAVRAALLMLLLLIAAAPAVSVLPRRTSIYSKAVSGLTLVTGVLLALILYWDQMTIPFLVHVACEGITAASTPYRFLTQSVIPSLSERYQPFVWGSSVAAGLAVVDAVVIWRLAVHWSRFRWLKIALYAIGLSVMYPLEFWLATTALRRASPYLSLAIGWGPLHRWLAAAVIVAVALAGLTFRLCARPWDGNHELNVAWRTSGAYLHERKAWAMLLAVAAIGSIVEEVITTFNVIGFAWLVSTLGEMLYEPTNLLRLALFLLACGRLTRGFSRRPRRSSGVAALNPMQFAVVWCLLFIVSPALIVAIACFSFALWLTPWFELPFLET